MTLPSPEPAALTYGDQMTRDLNRAAQNSLTQGEAYGFGLTQKGYVIYAYRSELWDDVIEGAPGAGVAAQMTVEGRKAKLPEAPAPMIVFDPTGVNVPFSILLSSGKMRFEITADGSGKITGETRS